MRVLVFAISQWSDASQVYFLEKCNYSSMSESISHIISTPGSEQKVTLANPRNSNRRVKVPRMDEFFPPFFQRHWRLGSRVSILDSAWVGQKMAESSMMVDNFGSTTCRQHPFACPVYNCITGPVSKTESRVFWRLNLLMYDDFYCVYICDIES